jgi:hypothetical protein
MSDLLTFGSRVGFDPVSRPGMPVGLWARSGVAGLNLSKCQAT